MRKFILPISAVFFISAFSLQVSAVPNFSSQFSTANYNRKTALLLTTNNCANFKSVISNQLANSANIKDAIEMPVNEKGRPNCVYDSTMQSDVVKVVLFNDDTDVKGEKQRIELKAGTNYLAKQGESYIYRWWFYLQSGIKLSSANTFFHNFQIKAEGEQVEKQPMATFSLSNDPKYGYHLRICDDADSCSSPVRHKLLNLSEAMGKWIQAYVKVTFSQPQVNIEVKLRDVNGNVIGSNTQGVSTKINRNLGGLQYRPKFGLYRFRDSNSINQYRSSDYALFQNIEIWKA